MRSFDPCSRSSTIADPPLYSWPIRVYYEDTDAGGVVYHANYLKFMERARTEWLRSMEFEQTDLLHHYGIVFVVRDIQVEFLKPAYFNDHLRVTVDLDHVRRSVVSVHQSIERDTPLCHARVRIVCVSGEAFRPVAIPQPIKLQLEKT